MKRQMLTLFLVSLILISAGGLASIVGAASHVTPAGQVLKLTVTEAGLPYIADIKTHLPTHIIQTLSVPLLIKGDDEG